MGDIVQTFAQIGEVYQNEALDNYNQIHSKTIQKIVTFDVSNHESTEYDADTIAHRLFLRVTSPNGGNLFPFLYISDKLDDGLKKAFGNMKKYANEEEKEQIELMENTLNDEALKQVLEQRQNAPNSYLALMHEGQSFNELFPQIALRYIASSCEGEVKKPGDCFMGNSNGDIGFDAGLNFCSVNELPAKIQKSTKHRLLPLSNENAMLVRQGFEKVFNANAFRFRIFGLSYYLLPSVFSQRKKAFFDALTKASEEINSKISQKVRLEKRLVYLVEMLEEDGMDASVLLTFLFAEKNNNEIKLYQSIEDVAPSRITKADALMAQYEINATNLSRYIKKTEYEKQSVYIRDYVENPLVLAKFIFGKEFLSSKEKLYAMIYSKMMLGNTQKNNPKREFSKIVNGYFVEDVDFEKHQRLCDFLSDLGVLSFGSHQLLDGGAMEKYENFEALMRYKFENVELLRSLRAQEFYIVGAMARFVMRWQYSKESETVAKYLDSIGSVSTQNIERVFRKVVDGAKKYSMHGAEWTALLEAYSEVKSKETSDMSLSIDKANIAFVMGSVDFNTMKPKKETKGEEQ